MSKQKNLKLNSKNNETTAKKLFKPLSQKEQQTLTGGMVGPGGNPWGGG